MLSMLQAQALHYETLLIGKIQAFSKILVTFELMVLFDILYHLECSEPLIYDWKNHLTPFGPDSIVKLWEDKGSLTWPRSWGIINLFSTKKNVHSIWAQSYDFCPHFATISTRWEIHCLPNAFFFVNLWKKPIAGSFFGIIIFSFIYRTW